MSDYSYKKSLHSRPASIINKVFSSLYSNTIYSLYSKDDPEECILEISTIGSFGPVSGRAIWSVQVNPHQWAQVIAEGIWDYTDDQPTLEIIRQSQDPSFIDCRKVGWSCRFPADIQWDRF
jgi:hypothetical protein